MTPNIQEHLPEKLNDVEQLCLLKFELITDIDHILNNPKPVVREMLNKILPELDEYYEGKSISIELYECITNLWLDHYTNSAD